MIGISVELELISNGEIKTAHENSNVLEYRNNLKKEETLELKDKKML